MCKELEDELNEGMTRARQLVEHTRNMGASNATIKVIIEDEEYEIVVRHIPVVMLDEAGITGRKEP